VNQLPTGSGGIFSKFFGTSMNRTSANLVGGPSNYINKDSSDNINPFGIASGLGT
jgi:hypothetical protein